MNTEEQENQPTLPPHQPDTDGFDELPTMAPGSERPVPDLAESKEMGDYVLLDEIARGGMGVVYRAHQKSLNREVAIKMILAGQFASDEDVNRFKTEAEAAAKLGHAAIVPIYEIGEHQGHHYFSMKYVAGGNLASKLSELRDDMPLAIRIVKQVADAVHHAHQRGILHRDLKPANILVDEDEQPYVTDLGLARQVGSDSQVTKTGAVLGTPSYMPPEQASGNGEITTAADIYSLGAILYEVLTGRPPFKAESSFETMMQVISEMPKSPSRICKTDKSLESICMKCLSKEPNNRYPSAAALASDLDRWLKGEPISVRAQSVASTAKFWMKQNFGRAAWALLIGPFFGMISGLCFWYGTIHQNAASLLSIFERLPSARKPLTMWGGEISPTMSGAMLVVFAIAIIFIGFVTAVFVRPKNQSADLAAGAIVGFFAMLAAFVFSFAALSVWSVVDQDEMQMISQIGISPPGETPLFVVEAYPELKGLERSEQIGLLTQKSRSNLMFQIPQGIWVGLLVSFAIYFLPCLFESWAAGPLLRKHGSWKKALVPYLEAAFPIVTILTVFGVMFASRLALGANGVLVGSHIIIMIVLVVCAETVRFKGWAWYTRSAVQFLLAVFFIYFLVQDFPNIPAVARLKNNVERAERRLATTGGVGGELAVARANVEYADYLASIGQDTRAVDVLDRAHERLQRRESRSSVESDELNVGRKEFLANRILLLGRLGQKQRAQRLVEDALEKFPNERRFLKLKERLEQDDFGAEQP